MFYVPLSYTQNNWAKIVKVIFDSDSQCESIGAYAFKDCKDLISIVIPENIKTIGNYAFNNCDVLSEIIFNATALEDFGESNYIFDYSGQSGNGITLIIGENVTKLPAYLFYSEYLYNLNVYVPKIVTVVFGEASQCTGIGMSAFYKCDTIAQLLLPDEEFFSNIFANNTGNDSLVTATHYYYSASTPSGEGQYWHYVDGIPTIW